jgi:hypothetical protein
LPVCRSWYTPTTVRFGTSMTPFFLNVARARRLKVSGLKMTRRTFASRAGAPSR